MVLSRAVRLSVSSVVAILLGITVCPWAADAQTPEQVDFFEKRVRPVLANNCYGCHSLQAPQPLSGLRLDSREALLKGGNRGPAIVPGDPSRSRLIQAVRHQTLMMPPNGELAETEIADLEQWVEMGAPWPESAGATALAAAKKSLSHGGGHWAFQPYTAVLPPDAHDHDWPILSSPEIGFPVQRQIIYVYVGDRLQESGHHPVMSEEKLQGERVVKTVLEGNS